MKITTQAPSLKPSPAGKHEPLTAKEAASELHRVVQDGFVQRHELARVEELAGRGGLPYAKQLATDFAELAKARFSVAEPVVKGFVDRLKRLIDKPDPVMQVTASGMLETLLQKLWSHEGTGGAPQLQVLQAKFEAGGRSVLEAVIEATGLCVEARGEALAFLAARAGSDADAHLIATVAATNGAAGRGFERKGQVLSLEAQRDIAVALAKNTGVSLPAVLEAAEPVNGRAIGWSATVTRLRAEVLHAVLDARPEAHIVNELIKQLPLLSFDGADPTRDVVPFAEALLARGAALGEVIKAFPGAVDSGGALYNSPPELGELLVRHAGTATGAAAAATARALGFLGDFPLERKIVEAMIGGKATAGEVLQAIAQSGTTVTDGRPLYFRIALDGVGREKAHLALTLYGRENLTADELRQIHGFAAREGGADAQVASLDKLIDLHRLGKDELHRLLDDVRDTSAMNRLLARLHDY